MKYFIIAGEASGDLHASNLIKEIIKKDAHAQFRYLGGNLMEDVLKQPPIIHYQQMAFMGIIDVVKNLPAILKNLKTTKKSILKFNPDVVILIDYPGFNLKIADFAKSKGFKTVYYIAPKLWAWKEGRVKQIKKNIDKLLVILPFEIDFYKKHQIQAEYVGNPVVDAVQQHRAMRKDNFLNRFDLDKRPIIALLPGSRKQEIKMMLPDMLLITEAFPEYQFVISGAPGFTKKDYEPYLKNKKIPVIFNHTYDLLQHAHSAIVTSGTAALETALFKVPQIVVYKTQKWQYEIGKRIVKIAYFSLPNLIMQREIIKELLQYDFNPDKLKTKLLQINHGEKREKILKDYRQLQQILGNKQASEKAADIIINLLNKA